MKRGFGYLDKRYPGALKRGNYLYLLIQRMMKKTIRKTKAMIMRQQLANNADERKTYIRMAFNALSDADKASNKAVLEKTREFIIDTFRG